ncbi:MAG: divergent polysaccharide deacetylase family protein [bacterium]|nr:divergent polysaccharide deacetylase family protein [bacterium]
MEMQYIKLVIIMLLLVFGASFTQAYQIVLDGEDPVLSIKTGAFILDKTGSFNGNFKFSAVGPSIGTSLAVWTIDGIPTGTYFIEFYVDNGNYAATAEYIIEDDYGVSTVIRSQNYVGTGWHSLATCKFTNAGRITQTDHWTGAGTKVIADALRLTYLGTPSLPTIDVTTPAITIVVDDLGTLNPYDMSTYTYQLFAQCSSITYAVMPFQAYTLSVLTVAAAKELETILHQPMQATVDPNYNPSDATCLYIGMSDAEILSCLTTNINSEYPYIIGMNNHRGSRFSQFAHGLQVVMNKLRDRRMIFYDSRTITDSVAYDIAKQTGLLTAERDLFGDGASVQDTKARILSIAERAKYSPNYNHLLICHQYNDTVPALLTVAYDLQTAGVAWIRLSKNVAYIVETDFQPAGASVILTGSWQTTANDMISQECYDGNAYYAIGTATYQSAKFVPNLQEAGKYEIFVGFGAGTTNAADSVKVTIRTISGDSVFILNQAREPNRWHYIGTYQMPADTNGYVMLDNSLVGSGSKQIRADCVKWVYKDVIHTVPVVLSEWWLE